MNFDHVADSYDSLARIIFGKSIVDSQTCHFNHIRKDSKVLIAGGGTGWILEYLPDHCDRVAYVEPSFRMMAKSKKRQCNFPVDFYQCSIEDMEEVAEFDLIITNFFLDLYDQKELPDTIRLLKRKLKNDGLFIATDFVRGKGFWKTALLNLMYRFFHLTTGLKNQKLPQWEEVINSSGFRSIALKDFYHGFIRSVCYQPVSISSV